MISKPLLDRTEKGPIETSREKNIEKYTQNIQINHRKYPLRGKSLHLSFQSNHGGNDSQNIVILRKFMVLSLMIEGF